MPLLRTRAARADIAVAVAVAAVTEDFPQPAAKRRKLEIRGRQQTLDGFFKSNGVNGSGGQQSLPPAVNGDALLQPRDHRQTTSIRDASSSSSRAADKRTLRSQGEPKLKSELSTYFPNYEEIILDHEQEQQELLHVGATLYLTDDASVKAGISTSPLKGKGVPVATRQSKTADHDGTAQYDVAQEGGWPAGIQRIELPSLSATPTEDPLADALFSTSHRRAERKEKQMRNIEREHAMHEKVQLDRLLDGLLGPDWLRVLGITGISATESKKYEPKRQFFVEEVQALVHRFKQWRDEERKQRLKRDVALAGREAEDDGDLATGVSTPSTDLNASASRQLQQETASALKSLGVQRKRKADLPPAPPPPPAMPDRPPSPIVSFYSAKHMRETALKRPRNSRKQLAFGQPLPEMDEEDFYLPDDYLSEDVLRASARERRRKKRENIANKPEDKA